VVVLEVENKREQGVTATILEELKTMQLLALEREIRELEHRDAIQVGSHAETVRPLASRVHTGTAGQPALQYHNPTASTTWQPARKDHNYNHPQEKNPKYRCTTLVVHAVVKDGLQLEDILKTISQVTNTPRSDIKIGDITPTLHRIHLPSAAATFRVLIGKHDLAKAGVKVKENLSGYQRRTKQNRQETYTALNEKGERTHWRGEIIYRVTKVCPRPNARGPYKHRPHWEPLREEEYLSTPQPRTHTSMSHADPPTHSQPRSAPSPPKPTLSPIPTAELPPSLPTTTHSSITNTTHTPHTTSRHCPPQLNNRERAYS
jgi:hypothetical protein